MRVERLSPDRWDAVLPDRGVEPFHTAAALEAIERHAPGELRRYAAIENGEPIGLLPAFVRTESLGTVVQSPPSGLGIPRLGPVLLADDANHRFVEALSAAVGADAPLTMFRACCPVEYDDPRPFRWADLTPEFVHRVPLRDLAVDGEPTDRVRIERTTGDPSTARSAASVNGGVPDPDLVGDIVEALGDRAWTYRAVVDDQPCAAAVVLFGPGTACCWFSTGARTHHSPAVVSDGSAAHVDADTVDFRAELERCAVTDAAVDAPEPVPDVLDFPGRRPPAEGTVRSDLHPSYVVESPGKYVDAASAAEPGVY